MEDKLSAAAAGKVVLILKTRNNMNSVANANLKIESVSLVKTPGAIHSKESEATQQ